MLPHALDLKNSDLDTFLYADVGIELNGSALTILSTVARLDRDPWEEAAKWAKLPKAAAIDGLAQSIAQMPLAPSVLADSRAIAARLVLLLPAQTQGTGKNAAGSAGHPAASGRMHMVIACCALAVGMALSVVLMSKPPAPAATPRQRTAEAALPGHRTQAADGEDADAPPHPAEASAQRVLGKAGPFSGAAPALP